MNCYLLANFCHGQLQQHQHAISSMDGGPLRAQNPVALSPEDFNHQLQIFSQILHFAHRKIICEIKQNSEMSFTISHVV